jgi:hypothetical protein
LIKIYKDEERSKWLDFYCKHPVDLKWSRKWLKQHFDCTLEGRKICGGKCCYGHVDIPTNKKIHVQYTNDEWKEIPKEKKEEIKKYLTKEMIVKVNEEECSLINFCLENPKFKPRECKLSPLTFSKKGVLRVEYRKICGPPPDRKPWCPNYKKGPPVWIAMKDNLIDLFGEEFYDRLKQDMK